MFRTQKSIVNTEYSFCTGGNLLETSTSVQSPSVLYNIITALEGLLCANPNDGVSH
jgi:hypothetical protein